MTLDDRLAQNIAIRGFESINGDGEYFGNLDDNSIEVIKQAILSDLLDIIGENRCNCGCNFGHGCLCLELEKLRQELIMKVKEYCE